MTETREHTQFGPYLVVRVSGAGQMGRVELALRMDTKDPEVCVIKRLHGALHDEDQEARFRREAQIAARLEHENIARTLRIEKIDGQLCIAQEFVEGVNLGRLMRQLGARPLPTTLAVRPRCNFSVATMSPLTVPLIVADATATFASTCPFVPTIRVPASDATVP